MSGAGELFLTRACSPSKLTPLHASDRCELCPEKALNFLYIHMHTRKHCPVCHDYLLHFRHLTQQCILLCTVIFYKASVATFLHFLILSGTFLAGAAGHFLREQSIFKKNKQNFEL